jgi:hypothetical protein
LKNVYKESQNILNDALFYKFLYEQAGCFIVVADNSLMSFKKIQEWLEKKKRLDILVINRVLPDVGLVSSIYEGQLGLPDIIEIPGGEDEQKAVNLAQNDHITPGERKDTLAYAYKELLYKIKSKGVGNNV